MTPFVDRDCDTWLRYARHCGLTLTPFMSPTQILMSPFLGRNGRSHEALQITLAPNFDWFMAKSDLIRLRKAQAKVARLVVADPVYAPIFVRLELELAEAEAAERGDVLAQARAVVAAQKAML